MRYSNMYLGAVAVPLLSVLELNGIVSLMAISYNVMCGIQLQLRSLPEAPLCVLIQPSPC